MTNHRYPLVSFSGQASSWESLGQKQDWSLSTDYYQGPAGFDSYYPPLPAINPGQYKEERGNRLQQPDLSVQEENGHSQNDRPFPCQLCTRAFARKHDLQRHIRVHTGAKPYVCPCCRKTFARTDALKRHLRVEYTCRESPEVKAMSTTGRRRPRTLE